MIKNGKIITDITVTIFGRVFTLPEKIRCRLPGRFLTWHSKRYMLKKIKALPGFELKHMKKISDGSIEMRIKVR